MAQGSRHLVIIGRTVAVIDVLEVKEISFPEFGVIENLGLKPRRFTAALLLNISTFTKYMLKCEVWKKPILTDFTRHQNKSRYCGAHWAV
jgi:hypothetical protein